MTSDRTRKSKIRAEMDASGLTYGEASVVVESRRMPDAGSRPPADAPMGPDPLGLGEGCDLFTAPLLVVSMLPRGREGLQAAQVIADCVDNLVDPTTGWYRARAEVFGPRASSETGMAPLSGYKPAMLLVRVTTRRRWTTESLQAFLRDASTAILAALAERYSLVLERHVSVRAMELGTAQQMLSAAGEPGAVTTAAHPSLRSSRGDHEEPSEPDEEVDPYPFRVVDAQHRGWFAVGRAVYSCAHAQERRAAAMPLDELESDRGPLREVVPAPSGDLDRLSAAFVDAGPKAVASLLVALRWLARSHADREYERSGSRQSGLLYAGNEDSWESVAMRSLIWELGVDLSDKPKRLDDRAIAEITDVVRSWVDGPEAYVEVARNLATAFTAAAAEAGGWETLADRHFQPGDLFAHSANAVDAVHAWLMGQPIADSGN
ncbi:hypothetical protein [Streptomyces sp. NPDC058268]|uniref:hypothetical protein n=1 Tax=Streptomyces sp. NPDC058268 TaxID=3346413 RepID=UPI0036E1A7F7